MAQGITDRRWSWLEVMPWRLSLKQLRHYRHRLGPQKEGGMGKKKSQGRQCGASQLFQISGTTTKTARSIPFKAVKE